MTKIDVTNVDLVKMIKKVYDLSRPQGLGFIHFTPVPLSDEEASSYVQKDGTVDMDYVKGRACKFNVFKDRDNGSLYIHSPWYDHTDAQLKELLNSLDIFINEEQQEEHSYSCNCVKCQMSKKQ